MAFAFPSRQEKAQYVYTQFERLASAYDFGNDVISFGMHRLWKTRAVDRLACFSEGSYLDVCCGTGDLALRIAGRLNAQGKVTGLDFSQSMLVVARDRSRAAQAKVNCKLEWVEGDAENLPFGNNTFNGAVISFGLRNLSDYTRGIEEMVRVVKPGGSVINLDLGHPTLPIFRQLFGLYFEKVVPVLGQIIQRDRVAYTYLPESAKRYPKPDIITQIFQDAGLIGVGYRSLAGGSVALHWGVVA